MRLSSLMGHCAEVMELIFNEERPASGVINFFFRNRKYLGSKDRAFIAEAVYHALRHRRRLEWLWDQFDASQGGRVLTRPEGRPLGVFAFSLLEGTHGDELDQVIEALKEREEFQDGVRVGREGRAFLDRVDELPWPTETAQRIALEASLPDWMIAPLLSQMGEAETRALTDCFNQAAPVTLRANPLKAPREAVQAALTAEGHPCDPTPYSPFGLTLQNRSNVFLTETFKRGWFEVQDEASQMVALCVDPKPGAKVIDACAGGGGKALQMSAQMKGRGEILALDIYQRRLDSLKDRAKRNDCQNIRIQRIEEDGPLPDTVTRPKDYVLVDAPCTGLGVLRRNPDSRWKTTPESVREMTAKQRSILDRFAPCLKPGGRLVYATCSILRDENEAVVESFLTDHPEYVAREARAPLSRYGLEGLAEPGSPYLRMWPHRHGTDGFFVAVMERNA